jgi:hypothetical protein
MAKLTITEALQEIKTIGKRLEKKRGSIGQYLVRDTRNRDPLGANGGSVKFINEERQAIRDLENNIVTIRTNIQTSNLTSKLTIGSTTRSVAQWLTWRKEISSHQVGFLKSMATGLNNVRNEVQKKGGTTKPSSAPVAENFDPQAPPDVVVNIDERGLIAEQEELDQTLGTLDGKLSLFNATTVIEI